MSTLLEKLRGGDPLVTVELRPPRRALPGADGMEAWIDIYHSMRRLARRDVPVLLTDSAVGQREEENLHHVSTNLGDDVDRADVVPFLTCNHSLRYCLDFARRAALQGIPQLVVLGGDRNAAVERCVPHAYELRKLIRAEHPQLALGGWANPHRDPVQQVGFLTRDDVAADFYLTQIVSHHDRDAVRRFLDEANRRGLEMPGLFGVFYYRSARAKTLKRLSRYMPVPAAALEREFGSGASAAEICARSIRALRELGARHVYVSNLRADRAQRQLQRVLAHLDGSGRAAQA